MIAVWITTWCAIIQLPLVPWAVIQVGVYASSDHTNQLTLHSDNGDTNGQSDRHEEFQMDVDPNEGAPEDPTRGELPRHAQHDRALDPTDAIPEEPSAPTHGGAPHDTQQDGAPFIERFPTGAAGVPISNMGQDVPGFQVLCDNLGPENIWHPFQSQRDWDFARWAKNRGPSSTAVTELLAMDGVRTYECDIN